MSIWKTSLHASGLSSNSASSDPWQMQVLLAPVETRDPGELPEPYLFVFWSSQEMVGMVVLVIRAGDFALCTAVSPATSSAWLLNKWKRILC